MSAVLVIAGTDSSGGAGLARDLRTLAQLGVRPLCAVTAVTAQSDVGVLATHVVPASMVRAQIEAAFASCPVDAVKIGMLATGATVRAVAQSLARHPLVPVVLDPVLASSSGSMLLDELGRQALLEVLLPRVTLLTPNIPEAGILLGTAAAATEEEMLTQARALLALGARAVLLKGGHARGRDAVDLLVSAHLTRRLSEPRVDANLRGTGCALATAIAAALASGLALESACVRGKDHVTALLRG